MISLFIFTYDRVIYVPFIARFIVNVLHHWRENVFMRLCVCVCVRWSHKITITNLMACQCIWCWNNEITPCKAQIMSMFFGGGDDDGGVVKKKHIFETCRCRRYIENSDTTRTHTHQAVFIVFSQNHTTNSSDSLILTIGIHNREEKSRRSSLSSCHCCRYYKTFT